MLPRGSYLVKLAIAAVEDELESDVGTVLDTADAGRGEVDVNAESALAGGLEERKELLEVARAVAELGEVVGILNGSNNTTNYS